MHANSPRDALSRLETMVMMAGFDLPIQAIRQQIASALDLIVHLERCRDGIRRVTSISEVQRMEGDMIALQDLFALRSDGAGGGTLEPTGLRPTLIDKFAHRGIELPATLFGPRDQAALRSVVAVAGVR